ncbi:MAG: iron ABC transporter substrate-binding protein [Nocardioides sp.]
MNLSGRRPRTTGIVMTFVVALVSSLSACSQDQEEAGLVVYSGRSESLVGDIIDDFRKESGHPVEVRYGDTAEMAAQLLEEGEQTPADVFFSQDAGALGALDKRGLLDPIPSDALAAVPGRYAATSGNWVGVTGRVRVLAFDPDQVAEADLPADVLELTEARWRGKVAIAPTNASFQSFVTAMRVSIGEDETEAFLRDLSANEPVVYENNLTMLDGLEAGEVAVGLTNHYYLKELAAEVGQENVRTKLKFLPPGSAGSLVNVAGVGLLKDTAQSGPATEFVDYLLDPATQARFVADTGEYALVDGVAGPPGLPTLAELGEGAGIPLGQLDGLQQTIELLTEVGLI